MFPGKLNDLFHPGSIRFRIRYDSFDSLLFKSIRMAKVAERLMGCDQFLILHLLQNLPVVFIQSVKLTGICFIILSIIFRMFRICLYKPIQDCFHFLFCLLRIQPDMRIHAVFRFSLPQAMTMIMAVSSMTMSAFFTLQQFQIFCRFYDYQILIV